MAAMADDQCAADLLGFLNRKRRKPRNAEPLTAMSLFSGAGLSDFGYELAGYRFAVQVEKDSTRAAIGMANFPHSEWVTADVIESRKQIIKAFRGTVDRKLDLLVATPPCQGLSSSNPSRGKRGTVATQLHDAKNRLLLEIAGIVRALTPRVIVAENVRQILSHVADGEGRTVPEVLALELDEYEFFKGVINVADYGVPQDRRRAVIVGVHRNEPCLDKLRERDALPWPAPSHGEIGGDNHKAWLTAERWFEFMAYPPLDASKPELAVNGHPLHFVPHYDADRYSMIAAIPPRSGASAYSNVACLSCGHKPVPLNRASCPVCREPMRSRPIVIRGKRARLIKGFKSSYRRMRADRPAPTITTNSSHIGSDHKIHPWENRVLSILECADLQTVPRCYNWSKAFELHRSYLVRNLIGEAFPCYFTWLHGRVLKRLLAGDDRVLSALAKMPGRS